MKRSVERAHQAKEERIAVEHETSSFLLAQHETTTVLLNFFLIFLCMHHLIHTSSIDRVNVLKVNVNRFKQARNLVDLDTMTLAHWNNHLTTQVHVMTRINLRKQMMNRLQIQSNAQILKKKKKGRLSKSMLKKEKKKNLPKRVVDAPIERRCHLMRRPVSRRDRVLKAVLVDVANLRENVVPGAIKERRIKGEKRGFARRKEQPGQHEQDAPHDRARRQMNRGAQRRRRRSHQHCRVVVLVQPHACVLSNAVAKHVQEKVEQQQQKNYKTWVASTKKGL